MNHRSKLVPAVLLFLLLCASLLPASGLYAESPAPLRFAFQDRIGSVIPIVADTMGYFKEAGVDVEVLRFTSGPACAEALYTGAADMAGMGDTAAIIAVSRSSKFSIVASHATGEHRHRIMMRKDTPFTSLKDLKGKKIAVKKGTSTYGGLLGALSAAGMSTADVQIVDLTPPAMTEALLAGSVDAFAASEPTPSAAEQKGARQLATLGGQGNEYPILMVANNAYATKHRDAVVRLMQALKKAEEYAAAHPAETAAIMAAQTGLTEATARKAMSLHSYTLKLDDQIRLSLEKIALFLQEQGITKQVPDMNKVVRPEFIEAVR